MFTSNKSKCFDVLRLNWIQMRQKREKSKSYSYLHKITPFSSISMKLSTFKFKLYKRLSHSARSSFVAYRYSSLERKFRKGLVSRLGLASLVFMSYKFGFVLKYAYSWFNIKDDGGDTFSLCSALVAAHKLNLIKQAI